jgi:hypothetical protein
MHNHRWVAIRAFGDNDGTPKGVTQLVPHLLFQRSLRTRLVDRPVERPVPIRRLNALNEPTKIGREPPDAPFESPGFPVQNGLEFRIPVTYVERSSDK